MRQEFRLASLPCLPYIGLYLTDITFIEENPDFVPPPTNIQRFLRNTYSTFAAADPKIEGDTNPFNQIRLINFKKCSLLASIFRELIRFQKEPFDFFDYTPLNLDAMIDASFYYDEEKISIISRQIDQEETD